MTAPKNPTPEWREKDRLRRRERQRIRTETDPEYRARRNLQNRQYYERKREQTMAPLPEMVERERWLRLPDLNESIDRTLRERMSHAS